MRKVPRAKMREAAKAGDLVDKLFVGLGLDDKLHQYRALIIWDQVVGPQIAARTKPVRVREGVLEVNVDQPTWMQQLQLMKPKILAQLNKELGKGTLKDIYLKRGKINIRLGEEKVNQPPAWRMIRLSEEERQQVDQVVATIEDDELRKEMEKFLTKQMRLLKAESES